jgi:hypothetical protein
LETFSAASCSSTNDRLRAHIHDLVAKVPRPFEHGIILRPKGSLVLTLHAVVSSIVKLAEQAHRHFFSTQKAWRIASLLRERRDGGDAGPIESFDVHLNVERHTVFVDQLCARCDWHVHRHTTAVPARQFRACTLLPAYRAPLSIVLIDPEDDRLVDSWGRNTAICDSLVEYQQLI